LYTAPAGSYLPNNFGLYDMFGNILEWTQDSWNNPYTGAPVEGSAWESEDQFNRRVTRGGYWESYTQDVRSSERFFGFADSRSYYNGIRLAQDQ